MKICLFAALAALALYSCDKQDAPLIQPNNDALVDLTFTEQAPTRTFFAETATAEAWEKSLSALTVYVFKDNGDLILQRDFSAAEIAARAATLALPHATAGMTCDFYTVANMPLAGVASKAELLSKLETAAAQYNGSFAQVSTSARRTEGFVMTAHAHTTVATGTTTTVAMTLKRTVAKIAVQTTVAPSFASKYSGTLTVTGTKLLRAASQSPIIAPATAAPGPMTYTHAQAPATASGNFQNLFYIFENGALPEANRVTLEIAATYDADGNTTTTSDRMDIIYNVPLTGKAAGEICRNGYYRVTANITGLVGQDCQISVTVAEWEGPISQSVDLGA